MTGSEGIALAGIVLSMLLGYLSYRTAREAREDAQTTARENREATAIEAQRARVFERRKDVYEEVVEYAFRCEETVNQTEPIISFEGEPGPPEWPSGDQARLQNARVAAWCSPELLALLQELRSAMSDFHGEVFILRSKRDTFSGKVEEINQWQVVEEKRKAVKGIVKRIIDQVGTELRG